LNQLWYNMFNYNASSITTFKDSIDEAYKQGQAHQHLINTIQSWIEADGVALNKVGHLQRRE
jgi:hypothetical protein